jgi:hypothetical protein
MVCTIVQAYGRHMRRGVSFVLSGVRRFLLKYISRDSVELLARGKNGVHEARNAIAKYEDQSPLYGLIIYRRRKVLIKYIPEGTSRLLQGEKSRD